MRDKDPFLRYGHILSYYRVIVSPLVLTHNSHLLDFELAEWGSNNKGKKLHTKHKIIQYHHTVTTVHYKISDHSFVLICSHFCKYYILIASLFLNRLFGINDTVIYTYTI